MSFERELLMNDREYQVSELQSIFNAASIAPVFKENKKYTVNGIPRITFSDIMNYKCIIRCDKGFPKSGMFWSDETAFVVAEYNSIAELVDDGWRLD